MKKLSIITVGAVLLAAVPATMGLTGTAVAGAHKNGVSKHVEAGDDKGVSADGSGHS